MKWIVEQPMIWVWEVEAETRKQAIAKAEELSEADTTGQKYLKKKARKAK